MKIPKKALSVLTAASVVLSSVAGQGFSVVSYAYDLSEVNIDTDNDGKPDINIDTDNDGKPDINIDTNGDNAADANIDTNGDGVADSALILKDVAATITPAETTATVELTSKPDEATNGFRFELWNSDFKNKLLSEDYGATSTGVTFSDLTANTTYGVIIYSIATNTYGQSLGFKSTFTTIAASAALTAPANVIVASTTAHGINVTWDAVDGADGYNLEYGKNSDFSDSTTLNVTGTQKNITDLEAGKAYYVRVKATDSTTAKEASTWSAVAVATTPSEEKLDAPTDLVVAAPSYDKITTSWIGVTGADGYTVEWSTSPEFTVSGTKEVTETSYDIPDLQGGTTYYIRVQATDSTNTKSSSNYSSVSNVETLAAPTALATPTGLAATTVSDTVITVTWNEVTGADGYNLEYGKNSDFSDSTTLNVTGTQKNITDLEAGKAYYFRISATDSTGASFESANSSSVTATTNAAVVAEKYSAPTMTIGHGDSNSQITLAWTAVEALAGYDLVVAKDPDFDKLVYTKNISSNYTSYTIGELSANTTYYARIRAAYKAGGKEASDWSNTISAKTENGAKALPSEGTVTQINLSSSTNTITAKVFFNKDHGGYSTLTVQVSETPTFDTVKSASDVGYSFNSPGNKEISISGLKANTTYYVRAKVVGNTTSTSDSDWYYAESTITTGNLAKVSTLTPELKIGITDLWVVVPKSGAKGWHLTIAKDADFTDIVRDFDVEQQYTTLVSGSTYIEPNTHYYVRVKNLATDASHADSDWTYADGTTYTAETLPKNKQPSKLEVDEADTTASSIAVTVHYVDKTDTTNGARIEVASDPEFNTIVYSGVQKSVWTDGKFYEKTCDNLSAGETYYVRAKILGDGTFVSDSNWFVLPTTVQTKALPKVSAVDTTAVAEGTTVIVSWTASTEGNSGYEVQLSTSADFTNPESVTVKDATKKEFTGKNPSTTYYARVRVLGVTNVSSNSEWSTVRTVTTGKSAITKANPVSFTDITPSTTTALATWTASSDYNDGYEVQWSKNADFSNPASATLSGTSTTLTGLEPNTVYYARVRVKGTSGKTTDSEWSLRSFTTQATADTKHQTPVLTLGATTSSSINVSWTASTQTHSGYEVQVSYTSNFAAPDTKTFATNSANLANLNADTTYYIRVRILGSTADLSSEWSNVVTAKTTAGSTGSVTKLNPVAISSISVTGTTVRLNWTASVEENAGYLVEWSDDNFVTTTSDKWQRTDISIHGLNENTKYTFRVSVIGVDGKSVNSDYAITTATTTKKAPEISPVDIETVYANSANSVTLKWKKSTQTNSGYVVRISDASGVIKTENVPDALEYTFTGLKAATVYTVGVRVRGIDGQTDDSAYTEALVTTLPNGSIVTLDTPTISLNETKSTSATVSWNAVTGADGYTVEIADDAAFTKNVSTVISKANVLTYKVTGLKKSTTYYIRVKAVGDGVNYAESGYSSVKATTTASDIANVLSAPRFTAMVPDAELVYLEWSQVDYAKSYSVEISPDPTFKTNVTKGPTKSKSYSTTFVDLNPDSTYYVRVMAHGDDVYYSDSAWYTASFSTPLTSSLKAATAPVITMQAIFGGVKFKTNVAKGVAVRYEICEDNKFEKDVISDVVSTTDWKTVTGLKNNKKYFIRVRSLGETGKTTVSNWTTQSFTTSTSYTSKLTGTPTSKLTLQMKWTAVPGADHYIVVVYDSKKNAVFEQYTPYLEAETAELIYGNYYFTVQPVAVADNDKDYLGIEFSSLPTKYNITKGILDEYSLLATLQLNIDTNGDGRADLNIDTNRDGYPDINIDTDGDWKADINIDTTGNRKPNLNIDLDGDLVPDVNIDTNGDNIPDKYVSTGNVNTSMVNIDWNEDGIPDINIDMTGNGRPDLEIDIDGDGKADINLDTTDPRDNKADVNVDTNGDLIADINIDTNGDRIADINIDTDGDGVADINIDTNNNKIADVNIDTTGDNKPNLNVDLNGDLVADMNIDTNGDGVADVNLDTTGDGKPNANIIKIQHNYSKVNLDIDYDGKPDVNIDTDKDGKADLNIVDSRGILVLNIDTDGDGKADLNIDTDGDGKADLNIDTDGDGKADLNIDTDKDGKPDSNLDIDGDGKADVNIISTKDKDVKLNVDTDGDGKPDINLDYNGDGIPDTNVDTDGDGKPDLNVDVDNDTWPDINIDTNGDGKADINIDTDGDGKPDINVDVTGNRKADINIDTDGDGKADTNLDTDGDGKPDLNVDTDDDGKADANLDKDGDGKIDQDSPVIDDQGDVTDPDDGPDDPKDDEKEVLDPDDTIVDKTTYRQNFTRGMTIQLSGNEQRKLTYEVISGNVTVDKNGLVKVNGIGEAKIKVVDAATGESEEVTLYITKGDSTVTIPLDGDNDDAIAVKIGEKFTLFKDLNTDGKVKITVGNDQILKLESDGTATPLAKGTTTVTFEFPETDNFKATTRTVSVTVSEVDGAGDVAMPDDDKTKNDSNGNGDGNNNNSGGDGGNGGNGGDGHNGGEAIIAPDTNPATGASLGLASMGVFAAIAALFRKRK